MKSNNYVQVKNFIASILLNNNIHYSINEGGDAGTINECIRRQARRERSKKQEKEDIILVPRHHGLSSLSSYSLVFCTSYLYYYMPFLNAPFQPLVELRQHNARAPRD